MKKLFSFILLISTLLANNTEILNNLADTNIWNKDSINKLLSVDNIDTSSLTDKAYKNIKLELEKCSKRNYKRCSVNTFKLKKLSNKETSNKVDKSLRNLSKEVSSYRKSKRTQVKNTQLIEKKIRESKSEKARLDYKEKQKQKILKAGYKGIKSIVDLYSDLTLTKSFYDKKNFIFKANNNFEFVTLVDTFAIFVYVKDNTTPIYIAIDRKKKIYSSDSYVYGDTFIFDGIQEFQGLNGIIQTIYLKNKVFYVSN
jgi:hypothetical protein